MILWLALLLQEIDVARGPYLQSVTADSVVVCWETAVDVEGIVEYGETEKYGQSAKGPAGTRHAVTIKGLKPGTIYRWRVGKFSGKVRTAPGDDATIHFVLYGDCRSGHKTHAKVAKAIAEAEPDFVLNSGDLVENGLKADDWKEFFAAAAPLLRAAPFYPSLGNHERNAPAYFDTFVLPGNERWFSFDYGPAHFIILDSNSSFRKDEKQLAWLREDLAGTKKKFKFAAYHHPAFSTSMSKSRVEDQAKMYELWGSIFEKGGLTAALQGHNHNYQRAEKNGTLYVTSGGGGASLYPLGPALPETKAQKSVYHWVRFKLDAKKVTAEAVDIDGQVIDRFERP